MARCLASGVRYVIVQAFNYNARPMHSVKDCVFGLMEREHPAANEIFVPKTISNCMALANQSTSMAVCIIDLERRDYIWADVESNRVLPTLENTANKTAEVMRSLIQGTKMSVFELLELHAQARGRVVTDAAEAETIYRWETLVTDYAQLSAFMSF